MARDWVGIQIAPISFIDEGVEKVLDLLQERASVNALILIAVSWMESVGGRTGLDYVGHGIQGPYDPQGGAFWEPDMRYYGNTFIKHFRSPDPLFAGFDTLRDVVPAARKRGIKVYGYNWAVGGGEEPRNVPNFVQLAEIDVYGRKGNKPCFNHPAYRAWILSVTEEWCQRYDVDGVNWGLERRGPLAARIAFGEAPACFCEHCTAIGQRNGIDVARAREGYLKVHTHLERVQAGEVPRDGYFVTFLRLLLQYPEILQWEKLWLESEKGLRQEIYGLVKHLDPRKEVGLGILHWITSLDPFLRAQYDYRELIGTCDWVKPILYNVPAGVRFKAVAESFQASILKDASVEECVQGLYRVLGHNEAPLAELAEQGFSAGYVRKDAAHSGCPGRQGQGVPGHRHQPAQSGQAHPNGGHKGCHSGCL